ncbi:hypothetical protein [Altererythrobacter sp. MF3-039]|uniref:hypothetical protein n=1 Tax=Altererythrobacter sp. MF3-039 TaxID=3252901 RepID=UPI00390C9DEA
MIDPEVMRLELFDVGAKYFELGAITGGILITVVTGFLVMAYTVGAQLSRFQAWLASIVFVVFHMSTLYGTVVYTVMGNNFLPANYLDPDRGPFRIIRFDEPFAPGNNTAVVGLLLMLGALYFLYDVRRKARLESEMEAEDDNQAACAQIDDAPAEMIAEAPEPDPEVGDATDDDADPTNPQKSDLPHG